MMTHFVRSLRKELDEAYQWLSMLMEADALTIRRTTSIKLALQTD